MQNIRKTMSSQKQNRKLRVLCADDEPAILDLFKEFLESSGCVVTVTSNGSEAYQANRQCSYDLVILDVNMPVMSGYEAIRAIRERNLGAYILLISGVVDHSELASALDNGADAVMKKPFTLSTLAEHLAAAENKVYGKSGKLSAEMRPVEKKPLLKRIFERVSGAASK